jgi:hypothetical protein
MIYEFDDFGPHEAASMVQQQLETNRSQILQLKHFIASESGRAIAYLVVACLLAGSLITAVLILVVPFQSRTPPTVNQIVPAVCIFLAFGCYQAFVAFADARARTRELQFLTLCQESAIKGAELALRAVQPEARP